MASIGNYGYENVSVEQNVCPDCFRLVSGMITENDNEWWFWTSKYGSLRRSLTFNENWVCVGCKFESGTWNCGTERTSCASAFNSPSSSKKIDTFENIWGELGGFEVEWKWWEWELIRKKNQRTLDSGYPTNVEQPCVTSVEHSSATWPSNVCILNIDGRAQTQSNIRKNKHNYASGKFSFITIMIWVLEKRKKLTPKKMLFVVRFDWNHSIQNSNFPGIYQNRFSWGKSFFIQSIRTLFLSFRVDSKRFCFSFWTKKSKFIKKEWKSRLLF